MFTPSLLAMMAQGLLSNMGEREPRNAVAADTPELFRRYVAEWRKRRIGPFPTLPVLGRTRRIQTFYKDLFGWLTVRDFPNQSPLFFFGRVPIDVLVEQLTITADCDADEENFELGTPLRDSHMSGGPQLTCQNLLQKTDVTPKVRVAVVDRGDVSTHATPADYGGKLAHAVRTGITMSAHAENVYAVLLERLDKHGILAECECHCALVAPRVAPA